MFGFSTGLVLGKSGPWSVFPNVSLPHAQRVGHVYVVGKTGKGKSKFLQHSLFQDIQQGRGCGVIDPHGDLITDLIWQLYRRGVLRADLERRLVYVNPTHHHYVVPFNVLATPGSPYEVAQNVIEAFRRAWPHSLLEAPHFSNLMLHSLLLLIKSSLPLTELPRLLLEKNFREMLFKRAGDQEIAGFFHDRFDAWGKWGQGAVMKESSLNKITALTLNPHLNLMLGQKENRLDFRALMDEGKVLLVDLGGCDEESARLIGSLVATGIEQAVLTRQNLPYAKRRPFYFYIDEFQEFSSNDGSVKTLAKILVSARKFGLFLTLAHQYLGQLSQPMQDAILGNVWTKVVFGISEADAQVLGQWMGMGNTDLQRVKHKAQTPLQHPIYTSLSEQWSEWAALLASQAPRQALVRDQRGKIRRFWTIALKEPAPDPEGIDQLRLRLQKQSGVHSAVNDHPQKLATEPGSTAWPEYDPP